MADVLIRFFNGSLKFEGFLRVIFCKKKLGELFELFREDLMVRIRVAVHVRYLGFDFRVILKKSSVCGFYGVHSAL